MILLRSILSRGLLSQQMWPKPYFNSGVQGMSSQVPKTETPNLHQDPATRPVKLSYHVYDGATSEPPLVFLHGLFGSKNNFTSVANNLIPRTGRKILTVDARNHGQSEHSPHHTYEAMSNDLIHLLNQLRIKKCVLIGHSMGGKIAMATALRQPSLVDRLAVIDISPVPSTGRDFMRGYINAMKDVKIPSLTPRATARRMADEQLKPHIEDAAVRQFLITNLVEKNGYYDWRVNLDALLNHLPDIMSFPKFDTSYKGRTIFLGGTRSAYISSEDFPEIKRLFPAADVRFIPDAGHWIHADKPLEFLSIMINFANIVF